MKEDKFLSVVIPAYNEEKNISGTLSEISEYLKTKDFSAEVIVVDDGSSDETVAKAKDFQGAIDNLKILESRPNMGKGYVLRKGMLKAGGDYVLFMDADNSTSIKELDQFLPFLGEEFDIYIASRRLRGSKVEVPFQRRLLGTIYIGFSKIILGTNVSDINCGFKIFKNAAARKTFSKQIMNDWSFDAEVLHVANKEKYKIKEVAVEWEHRDTSKVKPFRDGISSFCSLAKIRINDLKGKYK